MLLGDVRTSDTSDRLAIDQFKYALSNGSHC